MNRQEFLAEKHRLTTEFEDAMEEARQKWLGLTPEERADPAQAEAFTVRKQELSSAFKEARDDLIARQPE